MKNTTIETSRDVTLMSSCFFESIDRIRNTPMIGRKVISERIGKDIQLLQNYKFIESQINTNLHIYKIHLNCWVYFA